MNANQQPCQFIGRFPCREPAAVTITTHRVVARKARAITRAYCHHHAEILLSSAMPGAEVAAINDRSRPELQHR